nr:MAG TPA: hypothetical protein [Bacteriophage sp.]
MSENQPRYDTQVVRLRFLFISSWVTVGVSRWVWSFGFDSRPWDLLK